MAARMVRTVFVEEAARLLGVSRRTVYYRIRQGKLVTVKTPGGSSRVLVDSISALLREERARRRGSIIVAATSTPARDGISS